MGPLKGMPLRDLKITSTLCTDLSPLAGMPLANLVMSSTKCKDLTPLAGLPLRNFYFENTPVEDISPLKTYLAAVFRTDAKAFPVGGFQKENALSREETIRGMTIWAAKACFLEKEVGSIEVGKKADFILLDKDLMKVEEKDVLQTKVVATYLGGKRVW